MFHFDSDALGNATTRGTITVFNGETSLGTFQVDTRYNPNLSYVYTVTVTGDEENGVKLDIQSSNGNAVTLSNPVLSADFKLATKLNISIRGGNGTMYAYAILDDVYFGKAVAGAFAEMPTFALKAVSGENRIYTIANEKNETGTIYYTTAPADEAPAKGGAEYTAATSKTVDVTYSATGTYYAYVALADGTTSDIESINVTTGAVTLANATVTHSAANQYTISNDQSPVLGQPTATIHYQLGTGNEQTSTNASVTVSITENTTLTYWLTADGYTGTEKQTVDLYTTLTKALVNTVDFCTSNENIWAIKGDAVEIDGTTYYQYKDQAGNVLNDGLLATSYNSGENSWRIQRYYGGVAAQNSSENIVLQGLKAGQIVQYVCNVAPVSPTNLSALEAETYTGTFGYIVEADGNAIIGLNKGTVISKIYISDASVSAKIGVTGYTTLASAYALNLDELPEGVTAYYVTATGVNEESVTLTPAEGSVAAGTGLILAGSGEVTIPVAAEGAELKGNLLVGCTKETTLNINEKIYVLANNNGTAEFESLAEVGATIPAGKAYLDASGIEAKGRLSIVFGDATAIKNVEVAPAADGIYYNLAGQRVQNPVKGIYIVNGQKVMVK